MIQKSCCFAGSRSKKMPFDVETNPHALHAMLRDLEFAIIQAIAQGYTDFYTGMCEGFDLWAAEIVLRLRKQYPIRLIAVVPFPGQERSWTVAWKACYARVLAEANETVVLFPKYVQLCYLSRNRYMVNHASLLICYQNLPKGGTAYTAKYAKKKNLTIRNLADGQLSFF